MNRNATSSALQLLSSPENEADHSASRPTPLLSGTAGLHLFRAVTDNALQGITLHLQHRPIYANRAWAELHGMTVDEVMALPNILELAHPSEVQRLQRYCVERLSGGHPPERYRYKALHRSGRTIWLEHFVKLLDWGSERIIQSSIIDVDDQERKADAFRQQSNSMRQEVRQRAEALLQSNQQLHLHQSVIDQMSERISVIGTDYRFRMTNRANLDFRKRKREQLIGRHVRETMGDAWFERTAKAMLDRAFAGHRGQYERADTDADGQRWHAEVTTEPFRDPNGTISGAIVSVRDVTAARQTEEQLRLFASVIEQVSDRISVIDLDYRYRLTNKAQLDFHQRSADDVLGRHVSDTIGEHEFLNVVKPDLDRCFKGETVKVRRSGTDGRGRRRMLDVLLEPYRETDGTITGAVSTLRDVTEAQQMSERLAYQARYDQLTGLVNRRAFEQILKASIADTAAGGRTDALCFIDLDQFKIVNDTVGHLVGDQLLKQIAKVLSGKLRKDDVLARLGGDEFALLLHRCSIRRARRAAEQLISALKDFKFFHEGLMFEVGASIGITGITRHVTGVSDAMAQADLACYAAKDNGRNRVEIYKKRDAFIRRRRQEMYRAGEIRSALDENRFVLFGQPIASLDEDDAGAKRVEILLRMKRETSGLIMPSAFIPAAERYGFMAELDRWVISKAVGELAKHQDRLADLDVSINLSGVTLNDETSLDFIRQTLIESKLSPARIAFEITETAAIRNMAKTEAFMDDLRALGCRFALDDFGSGLSSLTYLKRLPVDLLKIDGSFIRDVARDKGSQAMVKAIGQMAEDLGIQTVAEGVEDAQTLDALKSMKIDYVQGYSIGMPSPLLEAAARPV